MKKQNTVHFVDQDKKEQKDFEEIEKSTPEVFDEQSALGSMPDPEEVNEKDTLETAQEMGLYTKADEEHPVPLGIAEEVNKAEKDLVLE